MATMDLRDQRAVLLAAMAKIDRKNGNWLVPSQSSPGKTYTVSLEGQGKCDCPDAGDGYVCKHIRALKISLKRELGMDGQITETREVTFAEKKSYPQAWAAYGLAQATEKDRLQVLLADLCRALPEPDCSRKAGPKPHLVKDQIFAMVFQIYCGLSSRRFSCDLLEAHKRGYVSKPIPGSKTPQFFEKAMFTPILVDLIEQSAAPLKAVESTFAVDSTGFSSSRFDRWYDQKYGVEKLKSVWVKLHASIGTKTNVVTAVRILDKDAGDCPQFKPLVQATAKTFKVNEVSADKAYTSKENFEAVANVGGVGYLKFKENATGEIGGLFGKMFSYFKFRQDDFLNHYHRRSNVEATFSGVKRKFGDSVRSRTDAAMVNEVLCKVLAFNLCCLIQEQHELGIDPVFWPEENKVEAKAAETTPTVAEDPDVKAEPEVTAKPPNAWRQFCGA